MRTCGGVEGTGVKILRLKGRVKKLEACLQEYVDATLQIYSTSKELGAVECKAQELLKGQD